MPLKEQQEIKANAYSEAMRYMENAKETLQKARKEDGRYNDIKYVRTACGTAYNGVLIALDAYLLLKGIEQKKGRKSIQYYTENFSKLDKKLLSDINDAYTVLHLSGYYDGIRRASIINDGFELASQIIDRIKPDHMPALPPPPKPSLLRRIYSLLFM